MKEIEGSTLERLVAFLYGRTVKLTSHTPVPLFVAADAHQVSGAYEQHGHALMLGQHSMLWLL